MPHPSVIRSARFFVWLFTALLTTPGLQAQEPIDIPAQKAPDVPVQQANKVPAQPAASVTAQGAGRPTDFVRILPGTGTTTMRFPAKVHGGERIDVSLATFEKFRAAITSTLGTELADTIYQSLLNKDYPKGMDDVKWCYKHAEEMGGYSRKTLRFVKDDGYNCYRLCLLNNGFDAVVKVEVKANQHVGKEIRPKKDFYFLVWTSSLEVDKKYTSDNVRFGTRARIVQNGIGAAINNPFSDSYRADELYKTFYFLDTPSIRKIIAGSAPAAMPSGISTSFNLGYTNGRGSDYNGYAMGMIDSKVLVCIPAKENYHIAASCLRPYTDFYLLLDNYQVELDDGTGSITLTDKFFRFNCSQMETTNFAPVAAGSGRTLHKVTKEVKAHYETCSVCNGRGKIWYANGLYGKEYVNMTYQKLVPQYSSIKCSYCLGAGKLYVPDATIEVYE